MNGKASNSQTLQSLFPPIEKSSALASFSPVEGKEDGLPASASFNVGSTSYTSQSTVRTLWMTESAIKKEQTEEMLQKMIAYRKKTLFELEKHCKQLEEANLGLVKTIESMDASSAAKASTLLEEYDRSGGSIASVQEWTQWQVREARDKLHKDEEMSAKRLAELEQQLMAVNTKLQASQEELHALRTYKDQRYPVQVLHIAELQREVRKLEEAHQDEQVDVDTLATNEMKKLSCTLQNRKLEILEKIASKSALSCCPSHVRQMSFHNVIMAKEVSLLKQAIKDLETDIADLKQKHAELLASYKDRRLQIFPDVFLERPKCLPDDEIVLDIPLEKPPLI